MYIFSLQSHGIFKKWAWKVMEKSWNFISRSPGSFMALFYLLQFVSRVNPDVQALTSVQTLTTDLQSSSGRAPRRRIQPRRRR